MEKNKKNFILKDSDDNLTLYEMSPARLKSIKRITSMNPSKLNTQKYLLNSTYEIKEGVLYISGELHYDEAINTFDDWKFLGVEVKKGSPKLEDYKKNYFIDENLFIKPVTYKRFNFSKFKREVVETNDVIITPGRYLRKHGVFTSVETSNFKIQLYEFDGGSHKVSYLD